MATAQLRDRTEHPRVDQSQPQTSKKPAKRGPRAIAVIEFLPKGGARLVPIALWMDGRYYDASFYGANPAPMALQPETLYQGMNYGEPTGWFTVTTPEQVNGNWVAEGTWKPQSAFDVKMAEQAAKQPKKKASSGINDDSGPPVLRRSSGSGSSETDSPSSSQGNSPSSSAGSSTASTTSSSSSKSKDDADRPTLKNSSPTSSTTSSRPTLGPDTSPASAQSPSAPAPTTDDNDPDRPTLKNSTPSTSSTSSRPTLGGDSSQASAQTPAPPAPSSDENDPDRPVLHRGKPSAQSSTSAVTTSAPKAKPNDAASAAGAPLPTKAPATPAPAQPGHSYPAISDAGVYETRSLLYAMTPAEKEERGRPMLALALDEVRNYTSKRAAAASPTKSPAKAPSKVAAHAPNFVVTDSDLRAFDLDFSNSPTLVLTAKVAAPSAKPATGEFDYFVTVVARVDINGQAQKVFSSVTDNNHLDAFPRLEIIDALDADANGRGDLLFRQHSDSGVSYALYRVYPYEMVKVFEGGAGI